MTLYPLKVLKTLKHTLTVQKLAWTVFSILFVVSLKTLSQESSKACVTKETLRTGFHYIKKDQFLKFKKLIEDCPQLALHSPSHSRTTFLTIVAGRGKLEWFRFLAPYSDIFAENNSFRTAFSMAASWNQIPILNFIKEHYPEAVILEKKDSNGETPLINAAFRGQKEAVLWLLKEGADPNAQDHEGFNPLQSAITANKDYSPFLHITDLNHQNHKGWTVLSMAIFFKNQQAFKDLIDIKSLRLNLRNELGNTPLLEASSVDDVFYVKALLEKGAHLDQTFNKKGETELIRSIVFSAYNVTKWLVLKAGADINLQNQKTGASPLIEAMRNNNKEAFKLLVAQENINLRLKTKNDTTAEDVALFLSYGGDSFFYECLKNIPECRKEQNF